MFFDWTEAAEQSSSLGVAILRRVFPLSPIFASVHWVNTMDTDEWDSTERERLGITRLRGHTSGDYFRAEKNTLPLLYP